MPSKCKECLKNINKNHLEDLNFQVEQVYKEAEENEIERILKLIDETYKKHSNKCSHTFIFILKQKLKGESSGYEKTIKGLNKLKEPKWWGRT